MAAREAAAAAAAHMPLVRAPKTCEEGGGSLGGRGAAGEGGAGGAQPPAC